MVARRSRSSLRRRASARCELRNGVGRVGVERRPRLPDGLVDGPQIALDHHDRPRIERVGSRPQDALEVRDRRVELRVGEIGALHVGRRRRMRLGQGLNRRGSGRRACARRGASASHDTPAETAINSEAARASCGSVKVIVAPARLGGVATAAPAMPGHRSRAGGSCPVSGPVPPSRIVRAPSGSSTAGPGDAVRDSVPFVRSAHLRSSAAIVVL